MGPGSAAHRFALHCIRDTSKEGPASLRLRWGSRGGGTMNGRSNKSRERLLYLISPIGLLALWQILLMLGLGDRRFIPAPSDIAVRFVRLAASGELAWHLGVTLWRVV